MAELLCNSKGWDNLAYFSVFKLDFATGFESTLLEVKSECVVSENSGVIDSDMLSVVTHSNKRVLLTDCQKTVRSRMQS
jgi:hypothetical protein